jgi:hypothetical protein
MLEQFGCPVHQAAVQFQFIRLADFTGYSITDAVRSYRISDSTGCPTLQAARFFWFFDFSGLSGSIRCPILHAVLFN